MPGEQTEVAEGSTPSARSRDTNTRLPRLLLILCPSQPIMPACTCELCLVSECHASPKPLCANVFAGHSACLLFSSPQVRFLPGVRCDVSRHRNGSEPALGSELSPFWAFWRARGLVVPGGVEG